MLELVGFYQGGLFISKGGLGSLVVVSLLRYSLLWGLAWFMIRERDWCLMGCRMNTGYDDFYSRD